MGNQPGKSSVPGEFKTVAFQLNKILKSTRAPREELLGQLTEALKTGGETDVNLPGIQRAVEASNQASSQAIGNTAAQLGAQGLQGSPFAARILAEQRLSAGQAAGQTRQAGLQALLGAAIPALTDFTNIGAQGALGGAQGFMSNNQFNAQARQNALDSIGKNASNSFCMEPSTRVLMLTGEFKKIGAVMPGDRLWSRDVDGRRVESRVIATTVRPIAPDHEFAIFMNTMGSPEHPILDTTFGALSDKRITARDLGVLVTCDLLLSTGTGEYFVAGAGWIKSTIDSRHLHEAA